MRLLHARRGEKSEFIAVTRNGYTAYLSMLLGRVGTMDTAQQDRNGIECRRGRTKRVNKVKIHKDTKFGPRG